jgi:hypothetical protein
MLKTNALTTVARLAGYLKISVPANPSTDYTILESIINAVSTFIETQTQRKFKKTSYVEIYDSERGQTLNLNNYPVVSTSPFVLERRDSQLNEDQWEEIDSLYYSVDNENGIIDCLDGVYFFRTKRGYRVTYTAGYDFDLAATFLSDTDAGDLEIAVWILGQDLYRNQGSDSSIKSERLGDYAVTYAEMTGVAFSNPQVLEIINKYKKELTSSAMTPLQSI